jgi:SAM-dependent methyltransferase
MAHVPFRNWDTIGEGGFFDNRLMEKGIQSMGKLIHKIKWRLVGNTSRKKPIPDAKEYSAIIGKGSVIPCQIEAYFLALNQYVDESATVLDVGFGLGYGLNILAIKAKEVSGVDVDPKAYNYCQGTVVGRNPRLVHLSLYDGYNLAFPDDCFDVVTCVDVLEHVEDYDRLLREMLRVSKKGVFISSPNRRPEYTNPDGTPRNYWHLREWSFEELDEILKQHGTVDWNFLNGPFEGPFMRTKQVVENTLTLSPFVYKPR